MPPKQPAAKDSHAKPAAVPVKSGAGVLKTNAAPAKSSTASVKASTASAKVSVAPVKVNAAPTKTSAAPAKANASSTNAGVVAASPTSKSAVPFAPKKAASASPAPKVTVKPIAVKKEAKPAAAHKTVGAVPKTKGSPAAAPSATSDSASAGQDKKASDDDAVKDAQDKKWSMSGKRDPFISPVVSHTGGSGCSTGKKCLEIGAINLRGVVHSDAGFIAVVTNSLNKAYFLRENDPVFDGYVVKITGDSVIFKETMQDRLGKSFTREVVKKLTTPAV